MPLIFTYAGFTALVYGILRVVAFGRSVFLDATGYLRNRCLFRLL